MAYAKIWTTQRYEEQDENKSCKINYTGKITNNMMFEIFIALQLSKSSTNLHCCTTIQ